MISRPLILVLCLATNLLLQSLASFSQQTGRRPNIFFSQLNTSHGLSDNYIQDMCMDKMGNLWIATGDGLNMFNGKTVTKYYKAEYPQFVTDQGRLVVCDESNRVWALSQNGYVTLIDEKRKIHRVTMLENDKPVVVKWVIRTKDQGVLLYTNSGSFALAPGKDITPFDSLTMQNFSKITIAGFDTLQAKNFNQVINFDEHNHIFSIGDGLFKVNFKDKKVEKKYTVKGLTILTRWTPNELLVFDREKQELQSIDLSTQLVSYPLKDAKDQFGKLIEGLVTRVKKINNEQFLIAVFKQGFYIFNTVTHQLYHYQHDAADPTSVINNSPNQIMADSAWVFLGCSPHGISYFKNNGVIGQQFIFQDKHGNSYDGYVNNITTRDNDTYYIGTGNNVLEWKRSTNTTNFLDYAAGTGESVVNNEGVSIVYIDSKSRLWIGTGTKGVYVLDKNNKLIKHISNDTADVNHVPPSYLWHMQERPDGNIWLSGRNGICRIDINTFKVDHFAGHPLEKLRDFDTHMMFFPDPDHIWVVCRTKGLWKYELSTKALTVYNSKNGLISDYLLTINKDKFNNLYVGTTDGLSILLNSGKIKNITVKDGLQNNRVEALLLDKHNRMWMGNDVGLSCFNIADSSLRIFDERYGLSIQGFRIFSYHQNSDDELVWGTERGIQYFYPDDLLRQQLNLRSFVQRVETRQGIYDLTSNAELKLSAKDNAVNFYFSSIEYSPSLRTFYRYKLEGADADWIKVLDQNSVRYSSLSPGKKYVFRLQASNDGKDWKDAENAVTITIAKPLLQQWWVKLGGFLLGILLIGIVINFYRKKQERKRNDLEAELVITYFASQINLHHHTDDLLWDVAKNCISKLKFEDCVIYLKNPETNMLQQKAAYGPKNPIDFTIHRPLEIAVGEGIVGSVAKTGKYELIENTEDDKRYIVDDQKRSSEIAVPIIVDNEVIGVIDSEHPQKGFFTNRHLQILSTVAVLCANQIQRTRAEEEKQKAKLELLENKQKATESRLQSLRLQMNPHFLFNALNSIQQMILANEDIVATKYLSRFSKLLRAILVHSDKETITLKEELEILNLYIELESIRFKETFSYKVTVDSAIEADEVKIPTLLIQPFVENAIWHGLMHKEGERILKISFTDEDEFIKCTIEDNGIGRKKAAEMKMATGQDKKHTSKGIAVSQERLKAMRTLNGRDGSVRIIDLEGVNGHSSGTRVEINFPVTS